MLTGATSIAFPGRASANEPGAAMSFIIGIILFVIVIGLLDARLIPWPRADARTG